MSRVHCVCLILFEHIDEDREQAECGASIQIRFKLCYLVLGLFDRMAEAQKSNYTKAATVINDGGTNDGMN